MDTWLISRLKFSLLSGMLIQTSELLTILSSFAPLVSCFSTVSLLYWAAYIELLIQACELLTILSSLARLVLSLVSCFSIGSLLHTWTSDARKHCRTASRCFNRIFLSLVWVACLSFSFHLDVLVFLSNPLFHFCLTYSYQGPFLNSFLNE